MTIFRRKPGERTSPVPIRDQDRTRRPPGDTAPDPGRPRRRETAPQNPQGVDVDFCYRDDEHA